MSPRRAIIPFVALLAALFPAAAALACLWDYDTIRDERRGLPGVAEVLAGRWERHSPFLYENRVARMRALIGREPANWAAYDNLAVALEKLGRIGEAIEVMGRKEQLNPGQYTTHANLGTFHLHRGELDAGIEHIRKALAINPNAHFGREEYQLKLAEFLRAGRDDPRLLTAMNFLHIAGGKVVADLAAYLAGLDAARLPGGAVNNETAPLAAADATTRPTSGPTSVPAVASGGDDDPPRQHWLARGEPARLAELGLKPNAIEGIVGIIRFGTGTSAELYLTLGDLLALRGDKHLAYRAYPRARELDHPRKAYLASAITSLSNHVEDRSALNETAVAAERAAAAEWVAAYQRYEDDLIRAGKDPEDETNLADFYAARGRATVPERFEAGDLLPADRHARTAVYAVALATAVVVTWIGSIIWRVRRRRARRREATAAPW